MNSGLFYSLLLKIKRKRLSVFSVFNCPYRYFSEYEYLLQYRYRLFKVLDISFSVFWYIDTKLIERELNANFEMTLDEVNILLKQRDVIIISK